MPGYGAHVAAPQAGDPPPPPNHQRQASSFPTSPPAPQLNSASRQKHLGGRGRRFLAGPTSPLPPHLPPATAGTPARLTTWSSKVSRTSVELYSAMHGGFDRICTACTETCALTLDRADRPPPKK